MEEGGREDSGVEVEIGVEKHLEVLVDEWVEDCKVEEAGGEESLVGNTSSSASKVGEGQTEGGSLSWDRWCSCGSELSGLLPSQRLWVLGG